MVASDDPGAGFHILLVMGHSWMWLLAAVRTTIGVVVGKLTRTA